MVYPRRHSALLLPLIVVLTALCVGRCTEKPVLAPEVEAGMAQWRRLLPELSRAMKAESVVPLWGVDGNAVQVLNSTIDPQDTEALRRAADNLAIVLRRDSTLFSGPFDVRFLSGDASDFRVENMTETARFSYPGK